MGRLGMAASVGLAAWCFWAVDVAVAGSEKTVFGPNLIVNGTFEEGDAAPTGWRWAVSRGAKASMGVDGEVVRQGRRSVRFHSDSPYAPQVYGGLSQRVPGVQAGSEYLIRLWARGKAASDCWFGGGPGWRLRRAFPRGDFDWSRLEFRIRMPQGAKEFEFRINIDGRTESLWVDDVRFQEVNPISLRPRVSRFALIGAARFGFLPAAKLAQAPTIDGDLADWPKSLPALALPEGAGRVRMGGWKGKPDLSATLRAGWDEKAFYLGVAVRDDIHRPSTGDRMWLNDSVQVAFDPQRKRTEGHYGPEDSEYTFALTRGDRSRVVCEQAAKGLANRSSQITLVVRRAEDTTIYEAAMPWAALGVTPARTGPCFGFSMLINDNDGGGRRGYIELTPGIGRMKDPSQFVTVVPEGYRRLKLRGLPKIAYTGEPLPLAVVFFPGDDLPSGSGVAIRCVDSKGDTLFEREVPLPPGRRGVWVVRTEVPGGNLPAGAMRINARVVTQEGNRLAEVTGDLEVSDAETILRARLQKLRTNLAETTKLAQQAQRRGLATDYERVAIAVAKDFLQYAVQDLRHRRIRRAEHVVDVLDRALQKADARLRAYLQGRASPLAVPRFVTGPVEVRDGAFWADTLEPTTGRREKRPVFFTGYGHFAQVVRDLPKFPDLGVNIIQIEMGPKSTEPAAGVLTDQPIRNYIGRALQLGAEHNVMICWLASPHYFPAWAMKKWPDLQKGGGGFLRFAVDAPQARRIIKRHLTVSLKAIQNSPALHSVCLSNEPIYQSWTNDPYRRPLWHAYLKRVHGTIERLDSLCGADYRSFDDVPILPTAQLPAEDRMTPLHYDQLRFNMEQFAGFHRWMSGIVHEVRPGTWTHAKVMCVPGARRNLCWGCDPEQFAYAGDLNGNDCAMTFRGFGDQYAAGWIWQNIYYDLQYSLRRAPIFNSENHIIRDREQRLIPPEHTDCALWQGAVHGQGATTIWVWARTYDRSHDFEGSILHRPQNVLAVGRAGLDLMRLAPQVVKLQQAKTPVAILYSMTSSIWSDKAHEAMRRTYEAMNFTGLPVAFVSERQAVKGRLKRYRALVLPSVRYCPEDVYQAVLQYAQQGGRLLVLGDNPFGRDEYGKPRPVTLPRESAYTWAEDLDPRTLRDEFVKVFAQEGIRRPVVLTDQTGKEPWAVEYRAVPDGAGFLISLVNLWGGTKRVRISMGGRAIHKAIDLRANRPLPGGPIDLKPLHCMLLGIE